MKLAGTGRRATDRALLALAQFVVEHQDRILDSLTLQGHAVDSVQLTALLAGIKQERAHETARN